MAAVSTIIAATALAYGVYAGEEQKKTAREAEAKSDAESQRVEAEVSQSEAVSTEMVNQSKARQKQRTLAGAKGSNTVIGGAPTAGTTTDRSTLGGSIGSTILGS